MRRRMMQTLVCLWLTSTPAAMTLANEPAKTARVERVYGTPVEFARDGDRFRRVGPLPASVRLENASIIDSAPGGYVLVDVQPTPVWIDKLNLRMSGTVPNARCVAQAGVSSARDSLTAGVRGAGERCP